MTEREQMLRYLTKDVGLERNIAELRMADEDLWVLHPDQRFDDELTGEEGVRLWAEAAQVAQAVAAVVSSGPGTIKASPALTQLVWDAASRAEEALERAQRRQAEEEQRTAWVMVLKDAVVQLDTARHDRIEEGSDEIAQRIEEVISQIEDELERLTGEEIPRPMPPEKASTHGSLGDPRSVLFEVNELMSKASILLQEAYPADPADDEAAREALQALSEAGMIVARLMRRRSERERKAPPAAPPAAEPENGGCASA